MIIQFYLLGPFEAQVGAGARVPLGDALAAQILAFLAFRNRFCSKDEIIAACWGPDRVSGKDALHDDTYSKQITKVRELVSSLGVSISYYFHSQVNGAQLNDGTFKTDIARFDELFREGMDAKQPSSKRLEAFQNADRLRRGHFLNGMHTPWIIALEAGERREFTAKLQSIQSQISEIQAKMDAIGGPNRVRFHDGFFQAIPDLRKAIGEASHEIICYGIDLRVTIPVMLDLLIDRLEAGVRVKFLLLDPDARWSKEAATMVDDDESTVRDECRVSLRRLAALNKQIGGNAALFEVITYDGPIPARMYGIDLDRLSGQLFYFPYMKGVPSTELTGYVWPHRQEGPFQFYVSGLRRTWDAAADTVLSERCP